MKFWAQLLPKTRKMGAIFHGIFGSRIRRSPHQHKSTSMANVAKNGRFCMRPFRRTSICRCKGIFPPKMQKIVDADVFCLPPSNARRPQHTYSPSWDFLLKAYFHIHCKSKVVQKHSFKQHLALKKVLKIQVSKNSVSERRCKNTKYIRKCYDAFSDFLSNSSR